MNQGYYSQPTISANHIAFISDDDLWLVEKAGGMARRLTSHRGFVSSPCFSPDGEYIAYVSSESGIESDVWMMPAMGGEARRLTWFGVHKICGWKDSKNLYFTSAVEGHARRETFVYELNIETLDFNKIELGPASFYYQSQNFEVLARNSGDSARWKRYQGGTAGVIWTKKNSGKFQRILKNIKTNLTRPEVVEKRIYFISDHEGVGNIYSCDLDGKNLKRHTRHLEYYCRNLRSSGTSLVYQNGAEIYTLDVQNNKSHKVDISCQTTAVQTMARFENWAKYFDGAAVSKSASQLALIARGQLFNFQPFNGPVKQLDYSPDSRFVCPEFSPDGNLIFTGTSSSRVDEQLVCFDLVRKKSHVIFPNLNWGKLWCIKHSPKGSFLAIVNNRNQLMVIDFQNKKTYAVEQNPYGRQEGLDWSPDGRYLAFSSLVDSRREGIKVWDSRNNKLRVLVDSVNRDYSPSFDPNGKYLSFLSVREFSPNYNETHFDLGFPFATRPYIVALNGEAANPFETHLDNPKQDSKENEADKNKKEKKIPEVKVHIEFDNINSRIKAYPVELGGYEKIISVPGGVIYLKRDVKPSILHARFGNSVMPKLFSWRFDENKEELFHADVNYFTQSADKLNLLLLTNSQLRLVETKSKPAEEKLVGKKSGFIDTSRVLVQIDPVKEWQQIYREAWVLQKEHFWRKDMSKVDWKLVFERYKKLLAKVKTRAEFSDLMWEMQGELGTSHCYEMLGDYNRGGANVTHARLGANFKWEEKIKSYVITKILKGDSWIFSAESPFSNLGTELSVGDYVLGIDGCRFETAADLYRLLNNKTDMKVELEVVRKITDKASGSAKKKMTTKGTKKSEMVIARTTRWIYEPMYRDWVEKNKRVVHELSKGKLGYVHIPDMGAYGYAEFYRNFAVESDYEGLVVDVRYNGGGHVSQHILKVLAQKILGFDETRYQGVMKYPIYAPGVLVAVANEQSGSDGDIFPHSFKLMKLGKLIGKRTWGGIIGINGQYRLRDGTWVTQPEYSFWFPDNEWWVENHGVDPDIEVEITPEDYRNGRDPQLKKAVETALAELKQKAPLKFKPTYYPDLSLPSKLQKLKR
jgi:tricorn protease